MHDGIVLDKGVPVYAGVLANPTITFICKVLLAPDVTAKVSSLDVPEVPQCLYPIKNLAVDDFTVTLD